MSVCSDLLLELFLFIFLFLILFFALPIYDIAFYAASFFLVGVSFASLAFSAWQVFIITLISAAIFFSYGVFKKARKAFIFIGLLHFAVFIGYFYFHFHSNYYKSDVRLNEQASFRGVVSRYPERREQSQKLEVELMEPLRGTVAIYTQIYPRYFYGDLLDISGKVQEGRNLAYFISFPKIERVAAGQGGRVKEELFAFKEKFISVFQNIFSPEEAALLSGLTLGERAEFSEEFRERLSKSGTNHIVALSGYNIALIVSLISILFSYFLSKRTAFYFTLAMIVLFVLMTGAEASVVRAAIMGIIALFAVHLGRMYSFRNAIVLAAFFMVLINPHVLVFDVGFALSFMALLGIVYVAPALRISLGLKDGGGFLGWRENMLATLSAQIAVIPILLQNFGALSPMSLPANILILSVIPFVTVFGFLVGLSGFISLFLAKVLGWFLYPFLGYIIAVIKIFSAIDIQLNLGISWFGAMLYYGLLAWFVFWVGTKTGQNTKNE